MLHLVASDLQHAIVLVEHRGVWALVVPSATTCAKMRRACRALRARLPADVEHELVEMLLTHYGDDDQLERNIA